MEFSQQICIREPTKHTRGYKGLKHFAIFESINVFANNYPYHYIIHTQHACPLQMNSSLMISITKLMSDSN